MSLATHTIANTSTNDEPVTIHNVEDALAQIRQMITGLRDLIILEQGKQFFLIDSTPEEEKVKIVFVHLFDKALLWHRQLIKSKGENVSWTEYKEAITLRFGSVYDDLMAALKNAKYDKSTKEYQDTFDNLLCRVEVSENHDVAAHRGSLKKYMPGHKCTGQLYSLVVLADNEEEGEEFIDADDTRVDITHEEWLSTLGDIKWNFQQLKMEFLYNNNKVCLRGTNKTVTHWLDARKQIEKLDTTGQAELIMMTIYPNTGLQLMTTEESVQAKVKVKPSLQKVIDAYAELFEVPNKLLPTRSHDYRIPLMPGTQPVNISYYRHPLVQKDAIKAMIKELLKSGLNKHIIKDKFPIHVIEELIDELGRAMNFSKLDLRSRYHQIRMCEDDIAKTTFKTHEGHYKFLVTPFGLTNAPSTFQALMNEVFREFLRKFTFVFFDDILIYSKSLEDHIRHLTAVLSKMQDHSLYAKGSKCVFGTTHVEYLGHVISAAGVATDPSKVQAMQTWPKPTTLKQLRIGAMLQQDGHPIAYLSKSLTPKHQSLSTYKKEFLAVLLALEKWRGYLLDRHFVIKTDHYSLKYLLDQRITTSTQMKWLPKLMGYDYEVVYKQGKDNAVVDALSRKEDVGALFTLSTTSVRERKKHYVLHNNQLLRKEKLVAGNDEALRKDLLSYFHDGAIEGHSRVKATTHKLCSVFYWKGLRKQVKQWVKECLVCQRCKPDLSAYPGLLQPLRIPKTVWYSISMDFIKGLPKSYGCTVILVVVDRLTKYGHFIPLSHLFTALQVAQVFLDQVCKLHRVPESIVLDRDKQWGPNEEVNLFTTPFTLRKQLTQKEYDEKRSKYLCFYYDQKYVPRHKCTGQLYSVILADNEEEDEEFMDADDTLVDITHEEVQP
ncbi:glycoside hydrolase, catalytic domain-containing protein [Tanacetum coccineum]